jgi:hypothetical protein
MFYIDPGSQIQAHHANGCDHLRSGWARCGQSRPWLGWDWSPPGWFPGHLRWQPGIGRQVSGSTRLDCLDGNIQCFGNSGRHDRIRRRGKPDRWAAGRPDNRPGRDIHLPNAQVAEAGHARRRGIRGDNRSGNRGGLAPFKNSRSQAGREAAGQVHRGYLRAGAGRDCQALQAGLGR